MKIKKFFTLVLISFIICFGRAAFSEGPELFSMTGGIEFSDFALYNSRGVTSAKLVPGEKMEIEVIVKNTHITSRSYCVVAAVYKDGGVMHDISVVRGRFDGPGLSEPTWGDWFKRVNLHVDIPEVNDNTLLKVMLFEAPETLRPEGDIYYMADKNSVYKCVEGMKIDLERTDELVRWEGVVTKVTENTETHHITIEGFYTSENDGYETETDGIITADCSLVDSDLLGKYVIAYIGEKVDKITANIMVYAIKPAEGKNNVYSALGSQLVKEGENGWETEGQISYIADEGKIDLSLDENVQFFYAGEKTLLDRYATTKELTYIFDYEADIVFISNDGEDDIEYVLVMPYESELPYIDIEGYVTGTPYTGVDEQNPTVRFGEVEILVNGVKRIYALHESISNTVDYYNLLGKKVNFCYSREEKTIVMLVPDEESIATTIIKQSDIYSITDSQIKYIGEDGKITTIYLTDHKIIYNGKYMSDLTAKDLANGIYELKNGFIEVLECGNIRLLKATSFEVKVVNSYDKPNEKIFFKYEDIYYQAPSDASEKPEIIYAGLTRKFDEFVFNQYDVLNFLRSPIEAKGNAVNRIYVTRGAKTGTVTERDLEGNFVTIGEKQYVIAYNYKNYTGEGALGYDLKAPFELDENYTFYLDYTGQIAAVKYSATPSSYRYGYIIDEAEEGGSYYIKLAEEKGSVIIYGVKDTLKLDGEKIQASVLREELEVTAQMANTGYNAQFPSYAVSGDYICQPVRYSISGGKIDGIDTVVMNVQNGDDSFNHDIKLENGKSAVKSTSILTQGSTSFGTNSATKILYVPHDRNNISEYAILSNTEAFELTGNHLAVDVFNIDQGISKTASFIVIYGNNPTLGFKDNSPYMVVTKTSVRDGEICFEGYVEKTMETTELIISEENFTAFDGGVSAEDVSKGDVIRYFTDNSGQILSIQMLYDYSNPLQKLSCADVREAKEKRVFSFNKDSTTDRFVRYGMPLYVDSEERVFDLTFMTTDDTASEDEIKNIDYAIRYKIGSATKIYEISGEKVNVLETLDSVYDMETDHPSRVMTVAPSSKNCTALLVYVIRD